MIKTVAVIGAGTMGSGIASHLANAGASVILLDVVPEGADNRNAIAEGALQRMLDSSPPAFMDQRFVERIRPGNVEDHLDWIAQADWIAEAVVERLDIKHALYRKVEAVRKPGAFVSSNTSTIPISMLTDGMPDTFRRDFCITHFFNPVRYMRLLEIVSGDDTRPEVVNALGEYCDRALGKGVVPCKDTPGFLGNRVGVFALQVGMVEAARLGITVEEADALMGRPMGIPKTGVFGLYDLIGLDLMLDVAESLRGALPERDAFQEVADGIPLIKSLVAKGQTGNKGGAGFYRMRKTDAGPIREAVDLETGEYREVVRSDLAAARLGETQGLRALVECPDVHGQFAWRVLARTLGYAASLVPEVADDGVPIDEAMKLGYSWVRGPLEMLDELGVDWFVNRLKSEQLPVPAFLERAGKQTLYRAHEGRLQSLSNDGKYHDVKRAPGVERLTDITRVSSPLAENEAASLWDVGDDVACVEFHTKANALSPVSMALLRESVTIAERDFRALVVHNDAPHFSVGFNLEFALQCAKESAWDRLDKALDEFQSSCGALKYATVPVVSAPAGLSLGGGFEVLLQSDALQAHANTVMGLVEPTVGIVPGGGGCKELLFRWIGEDATQQEALAGASAVFEFIGMSKTTSSPIEAAPKRFFLPRDRSTMNRDRLLAEAKSFALELAEGYVPPGKRTCRVPGRAGMDAMDERLEQLVQKGIALPHDVTVSRELARVLCGGEHATGETTEQTLLDLEREAFLRLVGMPETVARIEHMLTTGRPLRN